MTGEGPHDTDLVLARRAAFVEAYRADGESERTSRAARAYADMTELHGVDADDLRVCVDCERIDAGGTGLTHPEEHGYTGPEDGYVDWHCARCVAAIYHPRTRQE